MLQFMNLTKALADENRVRILMALNVREELCVCNLNDLLELAPSTVSKHLFLLKNARLVKARKQGRWMYYRLNRDSDAPSMVAAALAWVVDAVAGNARIAADGERLADLLAAQPEHACSS